MTTVYIAASKTGSIGTKYCERRVYSLADGLTRDEIVTKAIALAYEDGLEHVLVTKIIPAPASV